MQNLKSVRQEIKAQETEIEQINQKFNQEINELFNKSIKGTEIKNDLGKNSQSSSQEIKASMLGKFDQKIGELKENIRSESDDFESLKLSSLKEVKKLFEKEYNTKFKSFNNELRTENNKLKTLQNQLKNLVAAGAKMVEAQQQKFLKHMIEKATIEKINGRQPDFSNIATSYKGWLQDEAPLTEEQKAELKDLKELWENKQSSEINPQTAELKSKLETEINQQVEKGVKALQNSKAYNAIESQLSAYIEKELQGKSELYNRSEIAEIKALQNSVKLVMESENLTWKATSNQNEKINQIVESFNKELGHQGGALKAFNDEFKQLCSVIEKESNIQSIWKQIVQAIKQFCEKKFGAEFDKSVNNKEDLSNKQDRGAKTMVQTIIAEHKQQTKVEQAKEDASKVSGLEI